MSDNPPLTGLPRPGLLRRLAAMVYDALLLLGLELMAGLWLPALSESFRGSLTGRSLIFGWMILVAFIFFGYCWTHGGQTLGMRAWKMQVVTTAGAALGWRRALLRFAASLLSWIPAGLGYVAILFDSQRRAWHDRLSDSQIVFDDRYLEKLAAQTTR